MSYQVSEEFGKSPQECYQISLASLQDQEFEITKRRDIAWLVQVRKNIRGEYLNLNVQCRAGKATLLIISSQGLTDQEQEKETIDGLLRLIKENLK